MKNFEVVAKRIVNAKKDFVDNIVEQFNKTEEEANIVFDVFKKHRIIKIDLSVSKYQLQHGAFWSLDVINNALNQ